MSNSASDRTVQFGLALANCTSLDQCRDLFSKSVAGFGYQNFACCEIDIEARDRSIIYVSDWPEFWKDLYLSTELVDHDPFIAMLPVRDDPFLLSELRREKRIDQVALNALAVFLEHGWNEVFAVPLRRSDRRFGLITLFGTTPDVGQETCDALRVMSIMLYEKARRIVPRLGVFVQFGGLTLREMDCLRLVARGLTDQAIGKQLKISGSTVHQYIERAKQRLGTRTRAEVAALTVSLGLVEI